MENSPTRKTCFQAYDLGHCFERFSKYCHFRSIFLTILSFAVWLRLRNSNISSKSNGQCIEVAWVKVSVSFRLINWFSNKYSSVLSLKTRAECCGITLARRYINTFSSFDGLLDGSDIKICVTPKLLLLELGLSILGIVSRIECLFWKRAR